MQEKSSLLERLLGGAKKKVDENQGALEVKIKEQLKGIVYDDEIVAELAPVFMKLQGVEGFNQVLELLITKEKQIEAISGGDWFKKETPSSDEEEEISNSQSTSSSKSTPTNLVDELLKSKYGEKPNV